MLRQAAEVPVWFCNLEVLLDDINGRNNCEFYVKQSNGSRGDCRNRSKSPLKVRNIFKNYYTHGVNVLLIFQVNIFLTDVLFKLTLWYLFAI